MIHIYDEPCSYCGACIAVCPENIITLMDLHLVIDQPKCIDCAKCIKGCPVGALAMGNTMGIPILVSVSGP